MVVKCEACNREFQSQESLDSHNRDRHAQSSHASKEAKKKQIEEQKSSEAKSIKSTKRKRGLGLYGGIIIGIILAFVAFTLLQPGGNAEPDILDGLVLPGTNDHWHADYDIEICGERQPDLPQFDAGVHTHGDRRFHIHPHQSSEVGENANLGLFFDGAGVTFESDSIGMPGQDVLTNGDECPDGTVGTLKVVLNGEEIEPKDFRRYIMQEGDRIEIIFG